MLHHSGTCGKTFLRIPAGHAAQKTALPDFIPCIHNDIRRIHTDRLSPCVHYAEDCARTFLRDSDRGWQHYRDRHYSVFKKRRSPGLLRACKQYSDGIGAHDRTFPARLLLVQCHIRVCTRMLYARICGCSGSPYAQKTAYAEKHTSFPGQVHPCERASSRG